jgi:hypothetical protein
MLELIIVTDKSGGDTCALRLAWRVLNMQFSALLSALSIDVPDVFAQAIRVHPTAFYYLLHFSFRDLRRAVISVPARQPVKAFDFSRR